MSDCPERLKRLRAGSIAQDLVDGSGSGSGGPGPSGNAP